MGTKEMIEHEIRDEEVRKLALQGLDLCKNCINRLTKEELLYILKGRGSQRY